MKYLDLRAFHEVTQALNFDTEACSILGGCDAYTTKAAGTDKKLYKSIETRLEKQHADLMAAVNNLPPQKAQQFSAQLNVARASPFGPLSEALNRRKFAYLIATLNATHYDYDFSHTLRPNDFRQESMQRFMQTIDTTMYNLRPQCYNGLPAGAQTPLGSPIWSPRMWQLINSEMNLKDCEFYLWEPSDDPFFGDDGSIWSYHYFLFNKNMKRVCYIYVRGISALSNSPIRATSLMSKYKQSMYDESNVNAAARKRAEYWLGDRANQGLEMYGVDDELDDMVIDHPEDEVVDAEEVLTVRDREASLDYYYSSDDDSDVEFIREREKSAVRAMSEHITEAMEV
ncbi:mitogen-activated protein kinase MAF1 [Zopfia rhizophila CBS 207.26]|uniref:Repressor of RNA polymerase III transcription MAF1 n=1 Tax=Zopfia rhizophila CBS 207.26 TaxID=1314779 RepID=A0A6A6E176_9PEZI|nr:mitogen-activated protein kinase MAF1 [Zopfia rhizophila CBS 207.26]